MVIDQAKYAESVRKNQPAENNGKGIENFLMTNQIEEGFFAGRMEHFSKDKKAKVSDSGAVDMSNATYHRPGYENNSKDNTGLADKLESELEENAQTRKNQMVVLSNTTSPEDYKEMAKDGFSLDDSTDRTIITETDKIKAVMAQAGNQAASEGLDLSSAELEQLTGSAALANQIMKEMQRADLPVTTDNLEDSMEAYKQAASLGSLSDNTIAYMLENKLSPTIGNIYSAQYSSKMTGGYYKASNLAEDDFKGMLNQVEEIIEEAGLEVNDQSLEASSWLIKAGISLNAESLTYFEDLKNFSINLSNGLDSGKVISAMVQAINEGSRPADAMLLDGYSLMDRARDAFDVVNQASEEDLAYIISRDQEVNIANLRTAIDYNSRSSNNINISISVDIKMVTARRQLEEVRLSMTIEANYSLLKRGMSIDTTSLEALVEELKQVENDYYKNLLDGNGIDASTENVKTFADTKALLSGLQSKPAYAITLLTSSETLSVINDRADRIQADFEKVNVRYETMMTQPRTDLGDNIQKAFRNVDDILTDLSLETTAENQRAVRILAYNETEITVDNIDKMKAVDEEVQRTFKNMTPAVTLEMIRAGKNPLDMTIEQLNETASAIKAETGNEEVDRFSKYLWKLEQNKAISEEERSSYIGIYRLIAQVEKTDGAVIGSLINQGADITMRNLLSAVRTNKKGSLDYSVDEDFAGVNSKHQKPRIDDQIMASYNKNLIIDVMEELNPENVAELSQTIWEDLTPEQLKIKLEELNASIPARDRDGADVNEKNINSQQSDSQIDLDTQYAMEELEAYEQATSAADVVYELLENYNIPNSISNILAASRLIDNPSDMFKKLFEGAEEDPNEDLFDFSFADTTASEGKNAENIRRIRQMKQQILERFGEAVKAPEDLAAAQEKLAETATHAMDNMIMEDPEVRNLDIKAMKLVCKQFSLARDMAKSESYVIPVETSDGVVTGMSLKIVRGKDQKGLVDIFFNSANMGQVAASFEAKDNGIISGIIATDDEETKRFFSENLQLLAENINSNSEDNESLDLRVAYIKDLSAEKFTRASIEKEIKAKKDGQDKNKIQTKRLYMLAESFVKTISELTV